MERKIFAKNSHEQTKKGRFVFSAQSFFFSTEFSMTQQLFLRGDENSR